jgi:Reverse transcriptase (RNA-dependent DNA polymerase)
METGTFKIVLKSEVETDANIIPSRMILAIKKGEDGSEVYKARLVLGGHRDKEKRALIHNSNNVSQTSIRLLIALAAVFGFNIFTADVKQAYLQSASPLLRDIYVQPNLGLAATLQLDQNQLLKVLKPLYGLTESGDY